MSDDYIQARRAAASDDQLAQAERRGLNPYTISDDLVRAAAARLRKWQPNLTLPMSAPAETIVRDILAAVLDGRVVVDLPAGGDVDVLATEYQVSILPRDDINRSAWTLTVAYRGRDRYAVLNGPFCLSRSTGHWDYEMRPSEREDEWIADHRFDLAEALRLAAEHAPQIVTNGKTATEALAWIRDRVSGGVGGDTR